MLNTRHVRFSLTLITLYLLSSCSQPLSTLESVIERGELVVLTRVAPTTYLSNKSGGASGFEYELSSLFAARLGVKARFLFPEQFNDVLKLTTEHPADFAAAGLSITPEREKNLLFTPAYYTVKQQLIYHYRTRRPRSVKQLKGSFFEILAGTSHAENLQTLQQTNPALDWVETYNTSVLNLVGMVNDGLLDYTIADSNQFQILRAQYPMLNVAFDISAAENIAWAFAKTKDRSLYNEAVKFLDEIKRNGILNQLQDKYFGYSKQLNYVGRCTFREHLKTRFPVLRDDFHLAAKKYALDWSLLAAVAYQESHWNPDAISPTGVRGIMMLTQATAKQMKVKDRLDPSQSIEGGAHYLATRLKKIPSRIGEPDRTWMALASYNIGFGHLEDARILTQKHGADPDKWVDVKRYLPLLADKKWYPKTKYGYARGHEPVTYIGNVRQYITMLEQLEPSNTNDNENLLNDALEVQLPAL
ncbi:MAG: membrane-bound lytic murein transglycosylase MltF [Cycloclasticus sp.]